MINVSVWAKKSNNNCLGHFFLLVFC